MGIVLGWNWKSYWVGVDWNGPLLLPTLDPKVPHWTGLELEGIGLVQDNGAGLDDCAGSGQGQVAGHHLF